MSPPSTLLKLSLHREAELSGIPLHQQCHWNQVWSIFPRGTAWGEPLLWSMSGFCYSALRLEEGVQRGRSGRVGTITMCSWCCQCKRCCQPCWALGNQCQCCIIRFPFLQGDDPDEVTLLPKRCQFSTRFPQPVQHQHSETHHRVLRVLQGPSITFRICRAACRRCGQHLWDELLPKNFAESGVQTEPTVLYSHRGQDAGG